jgi:hypothetical protein
MAAAGQLPQLIDLGLPPHFSRSFGQLGRGGFGYVVLCLYRATPEALAQAQAVELPNSANVLELVLQRPDLPWVAVKVCKKPLGQCNDQSLKYLRQEVVNQRLVNHQHVIGLIEVGHKHFSLL